MLCFNVSYSATVQSVILYQVLLLGVINIIIRYYYKKLLLGTIIILGTNTNTRWIFEEANGATDFAVYVIQ